MNFTNIKKMDANTMTFTLENTNVGYANTLRRLILTAVETIGFNADMTSMGTTSDVKILNNDTPMTNETLAHRIGLLPIHITNPLEWSKNSDDYTFIIDVNADEKNVKDVTCNDFKIIKKNTINYTGGAGAGAGALKGGVGEELLHDISSNVTEITETILNTSDYFVPHPITKQSCLITTLQPGKSKLKLQAKATLGTGRKNVRWQPTSQCSYIYTLDKSEDNRLAYFKKWLTDAKKINYDDLDSDNDKLKALQREFTTMEIQRVYLKNNKGEPYSFDFTIESAGVLSVEYIVKRACEIGNAMLIVFHNIDKVDSTMDSKLNETVIVTPSKNSVIGYDFLFRGNDHTLGNLLQTYLAENNMNKTNPSAVQITYAGYEVPHPLRDEMILRIGVEDGSETTARSALSQASKECSKMFRTLQDKWNDSLSKGQPRTLRMSMTHPGVSAGAGAGAGVSAGAGAGVSAGAVRSRVP